MTSQSASPRSPGPRHGRLGRYVPVVRWLPNYKRAWLGRDAIAGIAVASVAVPTALGYAGIAHVPVQVGLYALPAALLLYAIFGSSRQLSVGPSSTVAIMSGSVLVGFGVAGDTTKAIAISAALAIAAGLILLVAGLLKVGWATDFVSKPVITGFSFGLGIAVIVSELPHLLGLPSETGFVSHRIFELAEDISEISWPTVGVGVVALTIVFGGQVWKPRWPWALIVLVLGIVTAGVLDPVSHGIEVVGSVPAGLPEFGIPGISASDIPSILLGGLAIALVGAGEGLSAGRVFAARRGYRIDSDQEFVAVGAANIGAGFSGGMSVCGSVSRTGTADSAGAKSQVSSLFALATVLIVLVAATELLQDLPRVILSAVVIMSVWFLLDVKTMLRFLKIRNNDFVAAMTGLVGVLLFGPLYGLVAAVAISILGLAYRSSQVLIDPIARIPQERAGWGAQKGHPERVPIPGLLVLRLASPIFWANAQETHDRILEYVDAEPDLRGVVLDLEATGQLDVTSIDMLKALLFELNSSDIDLFLARVLPLAHKVMVKSGFIDQVGEGRSWHSISHTVEQACQELGIRYQLSGDQMPNHESPSTDSLRNDSHRGDPAGDDELSDQTQAAVEEGKLESD